MTLKEICNSARLLHKKGGGLINRKVFVDYCGTSKDHDLKQVVSSESLFSEKGLQSKIENIKIANFIPNLTNAIKQEGHEFVITRKPKPPIINTDSVMDAKGMIWNPAELNGAHEIICYYSTFCWMRFIVVKELMHIHESLFDSLTNDHPVSNEKLNFLLMCVRGIHTAIPDMDEDLDNETSAFYLAIEYLLPWVERETIQSLFDVHAQLYVRTSTFMSAKAFFVPEYVIMHILQKDHGMKGLNYLNMSSLINEALDKEMAQ